MQGASVITISIAIAVQTLAIVARSGTVLLHKAVVALALSVRHQVLAFTVHVHTAGVDCRC